MERPKIIALLTIPREFECVKNHFPTLSIELERFCMCQKQLKSYWKKRDGNATDNTEISPIAYAVETLRGEHPSLQSKRSCVASCEPWPWSTDRFVVAVVIRSVDNNNTTVGQSLAPYSGIFWFTEEKWMWKVTALFTHSRRIEGSLLHEVSWEVGSTGKTL